jgi:hypothetical protein
MDIDNFSLFEAALKKHLGDSLDVDEQSMLATDESIHSKTITTYVPFWGEYELKVDYDVSFYEWGDATGWVWIELQHKLDNRTCALLSEQLEIDFDCSGGWPTVDKIKEEVVNLVQSKLNELKTLKFQI